MSATVMASVDMARVGQGSVDSEPTGNPTPPGLLHELLAYVDDLGQTCPLLNAELVEGIKSFIRVHLPLCTAHGPPQHQQHAAPSPPAKQPSSELLSIHASSMSSSDTLPALHDRAHHDGAHQARRLVAD